MDWLIAHLIGDYILQNDWMAKGKKQSNYVCTVHVLIYIIPFLLISLAWWQLLLIAGQHWMQDRTNVIVWSMRITGKKSFALPPMAPWSIIVTDNIWHLTWIFGVVKLGV